MDSEGHDTVARSFLVKNCRVTRYGALPSLDAARSEVALVRVELTRDGWQPQDLPSH